jgi:hypothetical protein
MEEKQRSTPAGHWTYNPFKTSCNHACSAQPSVTNKTKGEDNTHSCRRCVARSAGSADGDVTDAAAAESRPLTVGLVAAAAPDAAQRASMHELASIEHTQAWRHCQQLTPMLRTARVEEG